MRNEVSLAIQQFVEGKRAYGLVSPLPGNCSIEEGLPSKPDNVTCTDNLLNDRKKRLRHTASRTSAPSTPSLKRRKCGGLIFPLHREPSSLYIKRRDAIERSSEPGAPVHSLPSYPLVMIRPRCAVVIARISESSTVSPLTMLSTAAEECYANKRRRSWSELWFDERRRSTDNPM